jgi:hypothetical protein
VKQILTRNFKEAMPLPKAKGYPAVKFPDGLGYGLEMTDRDMSQTDADAFAAKHGPLTYLGHGCRGVAWLTPSGRVLKRTKDWSEVAVATHMIGKDCPCVVKVFDVEEDPRTPDRWLIHVEELQPMPKLWRSIWDGLFNLSRYTHKSLPTEPLDAVVEVFCKEYGEENTAKVYGRTVIREVAAHFTEFAQCLQAHGVNSEDAYARNVGMNADNRPVLFDLGDAEVVKKAGTINTTVKNAMPKWMDLPDDQPPAPKRKGGRPSVWYHATPADRIASIQNQGLIVSCDERGHWGGDMGAKCVGKVFLAKDPRAALYFSRIVFRNSLTHEGRAAMPILLKVVVGGVTKDPQDPGSGWVNQTIPPQNISYWWRGWQPLANADLADASYEITGEGVRDFEGEIVGANPDDAVKDVENFYKGVQ